MISERPTQIWAAKIGLLSREGIRSEMYDIIP